MKTRLIVACSALLLGLSAFTYSGRAQADGIPLPPSTPGTQQQPAKNRHPAIHSAIRALISAKQDLQNAAHDFGGHRLDAIAACDNAIAQLNLALQYANQNNSGTQPQH
jgi:chromosome segregation ATPase